MVQVHFKSIAARLGRKSVFRHAPPNAEGAQSAYALQVLPDTWFETPQGWKQAEFLALGDRVACLGGGFGRIKCLSPSRGPVRTMKIPGGTLGASSSICVPERSFVGLSPSQPVPYEAPYVAVPVSALNGYSGICPDSPRDGALCIVLEEEDMIWAQTGLLLHAPVREAAPFYQRLGYGETRAALTLGDPANTRPDPSDFSAFS
jgi:hypothetical protein